MQLKDTSPHDLVVALEVVTYDPLRRRGFMRVLEGEAGAERVVFALSYLPDAVRCPLVERSRPLNDRTFTGDPFRELTRALRREIVGSRFRGRLRGPKGWRRIAPRSLSALEGV